MRGRYRGMLGRIVIEDVRPRTPAGYPAKAVVGETVAVTADIYRDGHDVLGARVCWRPSTAGKWSEEPMRPLGNDRWQAVFVPTQLGVHEFAIEAWTDGYATWRHRIEAKFAAAAGQLDADLELEMEEGARLLAARAKKVAKDDRQVIVDAATALRDTTAQPWGRLRSALSDEVASLA